MPSFALNLLYSFDSVNVLGVLFYKLFTVMAEHPQQLSKSEDSSVSLEQMREILANYQDTILKVVQLNNEVVSERIDKLFQEIGELKLENKLKEEETGQKLDDLANQISQVRINKSQHAVPLHSSSNSKMADDIESILYNNDQLHHENSSVRKHAFADSEAKRRKIFSPGFTLLGCYQ